MALDLAKKTWQSRLAYLAGLVIACASSARADVESLAKLVPSDVLAAYLVDVPTTPAAEAKSNSFEIATVLIDQAFGLGFFKSLDTSIRGWLDAIAGVSAVIAHPHAVILFDIQATGDEDESHHVSELKAALVMRTGGNNKAIERRIQHLLALYTNQTESTLETFQVDNHMIHRLVDRRLADWVVMCWANVGDYFVMSLGEESIHRVLAPLQSQSATLWSDSTFRQGVDALAANHSLVTVLLRFDAIRKKSPHLGNKLTYVQAALGMAGCEQGLWTGGYSGRSLEIRQCLRCNGKENVAVIASTTYLRGPAESSLPEAAHTFAAIGIEPKIWFERIRGAYLAARSRKNASESRAYWGEVEKGAGFRFADLFSHLGSPIVVHDFPEHALRLPPAWTVVVPIQGEAKLIRQELDQLFFFWQKKLEGQAMALAKTDDGIWFLKVGLEGPAATVTDSHLVVSFSPHAVRQNLELLGTRRRPRE